MLLNRQDQHSKNGNVTKSNLQIQYNPIKIPTQLFTDCDRTILNYLWKNKNPRIAKRILHNKGTFKGITTPDIIFYLRAIIIIIIIIIIIMMMMMMMMMMIVI